MDLVAFVNHSLYVEKLDKLQAEIRRLEDLILYEVEHAEASWDLDLEADAIRERRKNG